MSPAREELSPRRRQILAAATTVLAQQGNRGLTHRAVDREAGLSEGSSSAYFRTRDALLRALGDVVADRLAADVAALGARLASCPGDHERAVAEVSRLFSRWLGECGSEQGAGGPGRHLDGLLPGESAEVDEHDDRFDPDRHGDGVDE